MTDWGKRAAEIAGMTKKEIVAEINKLTDWHTDGKHRTRVTLVCMLARLESPKYNEDGSLK